MEKNNLQEFIGQCKVHPLHTFRQGFRRTWIIRAKEQLVERMIYHDFGLAVIPEAAPKQMNSRRERFQNPRADRFVAFAQEQNANYLKPWAEIVAGANSPTDSRPPRGGKDGAVSAFVVSRTAAAVLAARPQVSPSQIPDEAPRPAPVIGNPPAIPSDLANMMAAAVEAALKPMTERLEATILPMQRTLESLQAEFIVLRTEEKDNEMSSSAAADAKRMRTDADM